MNKYKKQKTISVLVASIMLNSTFVNAQDLMFRANVDNQSKNTKAEQTQNLTQDEVNFSIMFKKPINKFNIVQLEGTKKILLDFYDVKDNLVAEPKVSSNLISSINTKLFGDRVRIILDTTTALKYALVKDGNNYKFKAKKFTKYENDNSLLDSTIVKTTDKSTLVDASGKNTDKQLTENEVIKLKQASNYLEIEHINIKKENGTTKVVLDLNNPNINPEFKTDANTLTLNIKGVNIPSEFQRSIDAKNLDGMLKSLDISSQAGSAKLIFQLNPNWTYSSYQINKKFVIEIKPEEDKSDVIKYKGKPLSLNFQNMDIRGILQVIADFTNLNIMASDSVEGSMSIRLKDVPWDQALNLVLESRNLTQVKEGNVVWIATASEISAKNKSKLEIKNQLNELEPLKLKFFQLNHYNAKEMKNVLEGRSNGSNVADGNKDDKGNTKIFLSSRGTIGLDIRNNTIFVQDTEDRVQAIEAIIKKLDTPVRQVLIEAKLVIATDNFQKQLGSKFGFAGIGTSGNNRMAVGSNQNTSQIAAGLSSATTSSTTASNVAGNSAVSAISYPLANSWSSGVSGGGSLGFTILNTLTGNALSLEISALESKSLAKVISSPKLLTTDNKKAEIKQGTQIPYTIPGTSTTPATIAFKDAFLKLGVTPQVSPNGRIVMDLDISKDDVGQYVSLPGGGSVPSIDTRNINTQVTVNDGQTVILGGIYEFNTNKDVAKVPFLGDIPLIGELFKNTNNSNKKVELAIMITPHIINDNDLDNIETGKSNEIDLRKMNSK